MPWLPFWNPRTQHTEHRQSRKLRTLVPSTIQKKPMNTGSLKGRNNDNARRNRIQVFRMWSTIEALFSSNNNKDDTTKIDWFHNHKHKNQFHHISAASFKPCNRSSPPSYRVFRRCYREHNRDCAVPCNRAKTLRSRTGNP